jgi:hypothetical protein
LDAADSNPAVLNLPLVPSAGLHGKLHERIFLSLAHLTGGTTLGHAPLGKELLRDRLSGEWVCRDFFPELRGFWPLLLGRLL